MAELADIFRSLLHTAIDAVASAETQYLRDHLAILEKLSPGGVVTVEQLESYLAGNATPDYFAGVELRIKADLSISSTKERSTTVSGGATWGPLQLSASFSDQWRRAESTNLAVECYLQRRSRTKGLEDTINGLTPPVLPKPEKDKDKLVKPEKPDTDLPTVPV